MQLSREHTHTLATATYRDTAEQLRAGASPAACGAVTQRLAAALDGELAAAKTGGVAIACAPGCAFCCHLRVSVFPHEAQALLGFVRARMAPADAAALEQRILATARRIDAMTVREHYAARIPCAFLVSGRCSAYEVRPSACAAHHSLSRERCEYGFEHPEDSGTPKNSRPASLDLQVLGDALIAATAAALKDAGLSEGRGELHQTLRGLLEAQAGDASRPACPS
jgi:Fe-S-cluster containining protein